MVAAQASPDQRTHLAVTVGPITVVIYDLIALGSYVTVWSEDADYAPRVFFGPEPDAFDDLAERNRQRERWHFERAGRLLNS